MFRHILLLKWHADVTDAQRRGAHEAILALPQRIDVIRGWHVGPNNFAPIDEFANHDYAIVAEFETVEDYRTYRHHPVHVRVIEEHTRPMVDEVARVQYSMPPDATGEARGERGTAGRSTIDPSVCLQQLLDRQAIIATVTALARAQDDRDWHVYRHNLADDVEIDQPLIPGWGGARRLSADEWVATGARLLDGFDVTQHLLSNFVVDIDGNEATCDVDVLAHEQLGPSAEPDTLVVGGRYHLRLRRHGAAWLLTYRRFDVRFRVGDPNVARRAVARVPGRVTDEKATREPS